MADQHDLASQLLARAADDETAVRAMIDVDSVADAILIFHAQQAVEKALKAVLADRGADFPFSHDLGRLCTCVSQPTFGFRRRSPAWSD